jgi:predicted phage terminase large subunit-like protein
MPRRLRIALTVDPSSGSSKRSNFFVIAVVGLDFFTMKLHVLDVLRERTPIERQSSRVVEYVRRWYGHGLRLIGIEAIFRQSQLVREVEKKLRGTGIKIVPLTRQKDKETRLTNLAMRYSSGDVIHPEDSEGRRPDWVEGLEEELCAIGWEKGVQLHEFDDQADAVNDGCDLLRGSPARGVRAPVPPGDL